MEPWQQHRQDWILSAKYPKQLRQSTVQGRKRHRSWRNRKVTCAKALRPSLDYSIQMNMLRYYHPWWMFVVDIFIECARKEDWTWLAMMLNVNVVIEWIKGGKQQHGPKLDCFGSRCGARRKQACCYFHLRWCRYSSRQCSECVLCLTVLSDLI